MYEARKDYDNKIKLEIFWNHELPPHAKTIRQIVLSKLQKQISMKKILLIAGRNIPNFWSSTL